MQRDRDRAAVRVGTPVDVCLECDESFECNFDKYKRFIVSALGRDWYLNRLRKRVM